ncbi:NB-ARC domain-containing protein [Streptomyces sp. LP11]|uniref:NB-ARC domain-containing protein n=1 Tax=Streptomyces pyxinicus TaxID=2970331 RepID=A0ABT2B7B5_9ACTN|nr:BTAD domain-containing putative transcriptional regulator [Streptomyces sp. LP11]MCS0604418.1 NB-ARC domain-containing protein [Streptomyces sp. LP11]
MQFRLLGRLELDSRRGAVVLPGALSRAIVGRLLLAEGATVRRDTLIDELWQDREAKDPVNALQVQVAKTRAVLAAHGEEGRLLFGHGGYRLVLEPDDERDTALFDAAVTRGRAHLAAGEHREALAAFRQGASLWRGSALEDLEGPAFEAERARLEELRLSTLEDSATAALELGRADELVPDLKAQVSRSPLREGLRGRLMLALYRAGRVAEALEAYEEGRRFLMAEIGAVPSAELRSLHALMVRHDTSLSPAAEPARTTAGAVHAPGPAPASAAPLPAGNLSPSLGPFVGRRRELGDLSAAVGRERLVTVLGPGGVGKTRLALEACARLQPSSDGVRWVELASADETDVIAAVAVALGLSDASVRPDQPPHDTTHRLVSFLAGRAVILVLDNCEHVLEPVASLVATLLGRCPALTVLATSRAPLGIHGEAFHVLAPLPDDEAADLFSARAVMIDPSFGTEGPARHDIRSLCRRLDGLPLAVELAAAHIRMLSVQEIEARLDNRFALLVKGERTAPARHRTLRAVLDWSYALLDPAEQKLLTELSLYAGGCCVEVVETAARLAGEDSTELLHLLSQLVDKSLLVPVPGAHGTRLRMLETVREYAGERLRDEGRAGEAEDRFTRWAVHFVAEGTRNLASGDQARWADRLTEESANIKAASDLLKARSRTVTCLLLEARLGYYWFISGREEEGIDRLRRGLRAYDTTLAAPQTAPGEQPPAPVEDEEWALFYTIAWLAWLNHVAGRHEEAGSFIERHEAAWHHARNPALAVVGPCYDTLHAMLNGYDNVAELFARAESVVRDTDFHWERAVLQTNWSTYCLQHGDVEGARRHGLIAVSASRAAGDDFARAFSLMLCGDADESDGLRERARDQWAEAARVLRPIGARARYAYVVLRIVFLDLSEGAFAEAERRLVEAVRIAHELSADDLLAATAGLRGFLALHGRDFGAAQTILRGVWESPAAPLDRRAVAAAGLAAVALCDSADPRARDTAALWADRAREAHGRVLEPLARRAIGVLLERLDACRSAGGAAAVDVSTVHGWLAATPSVLACFC